MTAMMNTLRISGEIAWDSPFLMELLALRQRKMMKVVADHDLWRFKLELLLRLLITRPKFY